MRRTRHKWYNMQQIDMSGNLPMRRRAGNAKVRYSAAYPTDAPEKLCFGGKPHEVRPEGPQGAARERIVKVTPLPCGLSTMVLLYQCLLYQ